VGGMSGATAARQHAATCCVRRVIHQMSKSFVCCGRSRPTRSRDFKRRFTACSRREQLTLPGAVEKFAALHFLRMNLINGDKRQRCECQLSRSVQAALNSEIRTNRARHVRRQSRQFGVDRLVQRRQRPAEFADTDS
jgi:hypothetical protein